MGIGVPPEPGTGASPQAEEVGGPGRGRRGRLPTKAWVAAGGLLLLAVAAVYAWLAAERAASRRDEPAGPEAEELPRITQALNSLGQAFRAADGAGLKAVFDVDRLCDEARGLGALTGIPRSRERQLVQLLRDKLPERLAQYGDFFSYVRSEVATCKLAAERGEALVCARHWDDEGTVSRMRWWLKKRGGAWRVYDFEELRFPMRASTGMALGFSFGRDHPAAVRRTAREFQRFLEATRAFLQGDLDAAEAALARINDSQWPDVLKAYHSLLQALVHVGRDRAAEALGCLDRAERLHSDMPIVSMLRATALNLQGEYAKAKAMAERYIEQVGADADIYVQLGAALAGLERPEDAAQAYRKGLDDDPDSLDNLCGLAAVLPDGRKAEVGRRFAKMRQPADQLGPAWDALETEGDTESIEAIVSAYAGVEQDKAKVAEAFLKLAELYREEEAHDKLAWLLATCSEAKVRDGAKALEHARKACEGAGEGDPFCLEARAAAHAEAGQFAEAAKWQERAIECPGLSEGQKPKALARFKLYNEGKPYREGQ